MDDESKDLHFVFRAWRIHSMEPITHFLTGACIGRAGFNRKTAYATLAGLLAAEAADLDILWGFAGPVEGLKHHRGITHTFWAVPVVAGVIVSAVWLIDLARSSRVRRTQNESGHGFSRAETTQKNARASSFASASTEEKGGKARTPAAPSFASAPAEEKGGKPPSSPSRALRDLKGHKISRPERITIYEVDVAPEKKPPNRPKKPGLRRPVHYGWLYLTAFIAALTHLLLDWTNNYGVRPFFPLNPRWYAGSFMFIAEPVLWALFFLAFFMPWILGLTDREIGARRNPFRGRGWAIFALIGMLVYGCWRWAERAQAQAMLLNTTVASAPVTRLALEPYPVNPFHWHAILETPSFYQTAEIDTRTTSIQSDSQRDVFYKPTDTPAVEAAKRSLLGQVYLDWGTWAVVRDIGPEPVPGLDPPNLPPGRTWTTVEFSDLRFDYKFLPTSASIRRAPLGGYVYIVDGWENGVPTDRSSSVGWQDAGEIMEGRAQH
jgi:inner membrane protein